MSGRAGDLFIHGIAPRSGTNFLARAVTCHSSVAWSPREIWEFPHLRKAGPLLEYARSMAASSKLPELAEGDVLAMVGDAWLSYAAEGLPEGTRLMIKEPFVEGIDRFHDFFPEAYLLILIRDGRDVAASSMRTDFAAPTSFEWGRPGTWRFAFRDPVETLARRWVEASRRIHALRAAVEGTRLADRVVVVRFEDLVDETRSEMERILAAVDLPAAAMDWDALADLGVRGSSFAKDGEGRLDWKRRERTESFRPVGRWTAWSDRRKAAYHAIAGEELRRWGYATDDAGDAGG